MIVRAGDWVKAPPSLKLLLLASVVIQQRQKRQIKKLKEVI